ncbi:hypothetical protein B0H66DRAFT_477706 [Apodospora peruviana]|uniref:Uncharacterized protein n=1 Tax=Apodospora peruviana TaxID=516989 RepID=A0AAE0I3U1_9PEZI|nr:hypothetical protein B0H66DRAFT_477706 [Apodospora peruviana]
MNETLASLLCGPRWTRDPDESKTLRFLPDGTGELVCRVEYHLLIAAEFDWRLLSSHQFETSDTSNTMDPTTRQYEIELTLTKRRIPKIGEVSTVGMKLNEEMLKEVAFEPRIYQIRFEQGRFPVCFGPRGAVGYITEWFGLRLILDRCPYPSPSEWQNEQAVQFYDLWDKSDFYGQPLE